MIITEIKYFYIAYYNFEKYRIRTSVLFKII